jgi:hypothetical protein
LERSCCARSCQRLASAREISLRLRLIGLEGREPGLGFSQLRLKLGHRAVTLGEGDFQGFDPDRSPAELFHALVLKGESLLGLALDPPLQNGEFGPQVILLRRQFRDRHGEQRLGPAAGQTLRACIDGWDDEKRDEGCCDEPQRKDHDAFDHADANSRMLDR